MTGNLVIDLITLAGGLLLFIWLAVAAFVGIRQQHALEAKQEKEFVDNIMKEANSASSEEDTFEHGPLNLKWNSDNETWEDVPDDSL